MYDVIIIGAGPAGISASLYTHRANLKTLVLYENFKKSSLENSNKIENYYGFEDGISGEKLYLDGIKQAQKIGVELIKEEVTNIQQCEEGFKINTDRKQFLSKTVILAIGNKKNKLDIEGIKKFEGKGISYCAVCDGFFFKNKDIAVIGNGNYAISETKDLINVAKSINILTDGEKNEKFDIFKEKNIIVNDKKIKCIDGKERVEKIVFTDGTFINIEGIFIAQGVAGNMEFARKIGIKTVNNEIIVNENMETNIKGLFACGDCTGGIYQISKAVYEGAKAGLQIIKMSQKNRP